MFKSLIRSVLLIAIGAVGALTLPSFVRRAEPAEPRANGPTIEQVRELSALVTTSVDVADVRLTDLRGWTGGIKVALLVRGQYLIAIDLAQARFEAVDDERRTAVLMLPPPAATSPRLDHNRSRLFAVSPYGLWALVPSDAAQVTAVNRAMQEAQSSLATAARDLVHLERARRQAEAVLGCFFQSLGWHVTIRWSDRP